MSNSTPNNVDKSSARPASVKEHVRVKRPVRNERRWVDWCLDEMLDADHMVRAIWLYVESLDLSALYSKIRAVEGGVGRDAVDPQILMALWMYATVESVSSARQIARLCERDLAFMWICGTVSVNYHLLSDFRANNGDVFDQLLTDTISTLLHQGLVDLTTVAQDGMRVRANAGSSSFRRKPTLEKCRQEAAEQVRRLREEEKETGHAHSTTQKKAAQKRAAEEILSRVTAAIENYDELQQQKEKRKKGSGKEARASTTDPEARKMKMGDGGFRPAYNVQFNTTGGTRLIVKSEVTNSGSDRSQMAPMHAATCKRYGVKPDNYLVDAGFPTNDDVTTVEESGTKVHGPMPGHKHQDEKCDPYARRPGDSNETAAFRKRMRTPEAQKILKQRPSIAEFPNAECRNRGLHQFRVRGLDRVRSSTLLYVLTFNFMRMRSLNFI